MTEPKKKVVVNVSEVDELRQAVVGLASRVNSLSKALTTVNDIQIRQIETERQTTAIKEKAEQAAETVRAVEEIVVPREEHEQRWREEQQDLIRLRKQIRRKTYVVGATFFLLSLLALGATTGLVAWNQHQEHVITHKACVTRLKASQGAVLAYGKLLEHSPTLQKDSGLRGLIVAARNTALAGSKVKC